MSLKNPTLAALVESFRGQELDPHYLAFFDCFNRQLYFEAHEVLEILWLAQRREPQGAFYKGLIQLAGAFVHLQKNRLRPAAALFKLAETNLKPYAPSHHRLAVNAVIAMIDQWLTRLEQGAFQVNPLTAATVPVLSLAKV